MEYNIIEIQNDIYKCDKLFDEVKNRLDNEILNIYEEIAYVNQLLRILTLKTELNYKLDKLKKEKQNI